MTTTNPPQRDPYRVNLSAWWNKLARRVRTERPHCITCGSSQDLNAIRSPRAFARTAASLRIRGCDLLVVCTPCKPIVGSPLPGRPWFIAWEEGDGDVHSTNLDTLLPSTHRAEVEAA